MLIPNHPHAERLSALASGDPDAVADSVLSEHVASCHRCTDTVAELGALRASLAELPDLRPHRPLQLLPPVTEPSASRADGIGGWARRFFAPVLTAGAALAMIGLVGTSLPLLGQAASQADGAPDMAEMAAPEASGQRLSADGAYDVDAAGEGGAATGESAEEPTLVRPFQSEVAGADVDAANVDGDQGTTTATLERSIWPMVLFTGVALMVAAVLLRWILVPRAG